MEPNNSEISFEYLPFGKKGKVQMLVHMPGATFSDKFDITDSNRREHFVKKLLKRHPGLNEQDIRAELERISCEIVGHAIHQEREAPPYVDEDERDKAADGKDVDLLVGITKGEDVELFHIGSRHDAEACATIVVDGHRETWPIQSSGFSHWLRRRFYTLCERAPSAQAFTDAINLIASIAIFDGPQGQVFVRLAEYEGEIWLDLADDEWRAVRITAFDWQVVDGMKVPVRFLRRRGMLPLPVPVRGGSIDELRPFVNMPTVDLWTLYAGSLPSLFRPRGPFAVLVFTGPQGSAKSSSVRKTRALVDPNKSPLRRLTRDERDLMIAANNGFVLAFDNLSTIPPSISDALCCLATGGGFSTRQLYTDDEEKLFDAMRPVVLNGIEDVATRPDLLDRSVLLNLPPMAEEKLREEAELDRAFELARPRILGALLSAASTALRRVDLVTLDRRPRMVDFAKWCTAAETSFGWKEGTFLAAYMRNRSDAQAIAIESSAIGQPLLALMENLERWQGSAGELLELLESAHASPRTRERKDWPTTPKAMSDALKRIAPTLRAFGIEIEIGKRKAGGKRERQVILTKLKPEAPPPSPDTGTVDGAGGDSDQGDDRPGKSASGCPPSGGRDGRDAWDGRVPTCSTNKCESTARENCPPDDAGSAPGTDQPGGVHHISAEAVGTRVSQPSQPSRSGLGDPEKADSPGRSRDGHGADGTDDRPGPDDVVEPLEPPRRRAKQDGFFEDPEPWDH